jgi:hypothetical protein
LVVAVVAAVVVVAVRGSNGSIGRNCMHRAAVLGGGGWGGIRYSYSRSHNHTSGFGSRGSRRLLSRSKNIIGTRVRNSFRSIRNSIRSRKSN